MDQGADRRRGRLPAVQLDHARRQAGRLRHRHRQGAVRRDEGRVHAGAAGLGRHHPGPAGQEVRRDRRLDVDHRGAQAEGRLHQEVLPDAGPVRGQEGLRASRSRKEGLARARRSACSAPPSTTASSPTISATRSRSSATHPGRGQPRPRRRPGRPAARPTVAPERRPAQDRPRARISSSSGPSLLRPEMVRRGRRHRDPQVRHRSDAKLNAAIDAIRANGTWDKIAAKYFDFDVYGS